MFNRFPSRSYAACRATVSCLPGGRALLPASQEQNYLPVTVTGLWRTDHRTFRPVPPDIGVPESHRLRRLEVLAPGCMSPRQWPRISDWGTPWGLPMHTPALTEKVVQEANLIRNRHVDGQGIVSGHGVLYRALVVSVRHEMPSGPLSEVSHGACSAFLSYGSLKTSSLAAGIPTQSPPQPEPLNRRSTPNQR